LGFVLLGLLLAASAAPASEKHKARAASSGDRAKAFEEVKVTWVDGETVLEKIAGATRKIKDHLEVTGQNLGGFLKDNGVDVSAGFAAVTRKVKELFGRADAKDFATKLAEAAEKVQKSLEEQLAPITAKLGESMIQKETAKQASSGDPAGEKELSEEQLEELGLGSETVQELTKNLQEGLMRALEKVNPNAEDVAADLAKAKEGVDKISAWADELYKSGVPVEKIKKLLETAGLHAVRSEEASGQETHDEL